MPSIEARRQRIVDELTARRIHEPGPLLPLLHDIQHELGFIPPEVVPGIAHALNLSRAEVHGVISFYHHFRQQQPGRHILRVCRAEACQAVEGDATQNHARQCLGVDYHDTCAAGDFTLEAAYCLGNCAAGPSVMIDGTLYGRVTPRRLDELLTQWRSRP